MSNCADPCLRLQCAAPPEHSPSAPAAARQAPAGCAPRIVLEGDWVQCLGRFWAFRVSGLGFRL